MGRGPLFLNERLDLPPTADSARTCRRFLADVLERWGLATLSPTAELCGSELAANAVLHAGTPFTVCVLRLSNGIRVEVCDGSPDVPLPVPRAGSAPEIMEFALTGRGLQVVDGLSSAWGIDVDTGGKTVWFEVALPDADTDESAEPDTGPDVMLRLRSLPVRAAVASGRQVDDLVREIQLGGEGWTASGTMERLRRALDRSAAARLAGRAAALGAAAGNQTRFDLDLDLPLDALVAVDELNALLDEVSEAVQQRSLAAVAPEPAVRAFREWVVDEVGRQLRGEDPAPCPLPD